MANAVFQEMNTVLSTPETIKDLVSLTCNRFLAVYDAYSTKT